jgi:hypothetical protein
MRFWVDPNASSQPPWPKPFFRGLDHLVFASFDAESSLLIDLHTCRAIGRFSPAIADHRAYWRTVVFPVVISIIGATVGITELHCGCVARDGRGLLLVGGSGSGKSTLALALAQSGFGYLSDDRTYVSAWEGGIAAWGMPTLLKLRPDAAQWLRGVRESRHSPTGNGEPALWFDPAVDLGVRRVQRCEPVVLVFLKRRQAPIFSVSALPRDQAAQKLQADWMFEEPAAAERQREMVTQLLTLSCWELEFGGPPDAVARLLETRLPL